MTSRGIGRFWSTARTENSGIACAAEPWSPENPFDSAHKRNVVVAATGHDEDNLVVCLLGKYEYGVHLTMARVNNPKNEWLFSERFGVDAPVSQTTMIADLLRKHVPGER